MARAKNTGMVLHHQVEYDTINNILTEFKDKTIINSNKIRMLLDRLQLKSLLDAGEYKKWIKDKCKKDSKNDVTAKEKIEYFITILQRKHMARNVLIRWLDDIDVAGTIKKSIYEKEMIYALKEIRNKQSSSRTVEREWFTSLGFLVGNEDGPKSLIRALTNAGCGYNGNDPEMLRETLIAYMAKHKNLPNSKILRLGLGMDDSKPFFHEKHGEVKMDVRLILAACKYLRKNIHIIYISSQDEDLEQTMERPVTQAVQLTLYTYPMMTERHMYLGHMGTNRYVSLLQKEGKRLHDDQDHDEQLATIESQQMRIDYLDSLLKEKEKELEKMSTEKKIMEGNFKELEEKQRAIIEDLKRQLRSVQQEQQEMDIMHGSIVETLKDDLKKEKEERMKFETTLQGAKDEFDKFTQKMGQMFTVLDK